MDLDYIFAKRTKSKKRQYVFKRTPGLPEINPQKRCEGKQIGVLDSDMATRVLQQGGRAFDLWTGLEYKITCGNLLQLGD